MKTQRKGLDYRNRLYSILLALILLCFLVGYFLYMLPSLYVDYRMEQNLKSIKLQHETYVAEGSYRNIKVSNPTTCASLKIPYQGDSVSLAGCGFRIELTAEADYMKTILAELQELLSQYQTISSREEDREQWSRSLEAALERWRELLGSASENSFSLPFAVTAVQDGTFDYQSQYAKVHSVSDRYLILEAVSADSNNTYTAYIALEDIGDSFVFTILSSLTPDMNEIRPVVLQSLPMICAMVLLLVLIFSQVYSRRILAPLYTVLEHQNQALAEENKKQEIFMRASSHKLKTPLSAALLLLDGMINRVGKYKNTQEYLPKVKSQLLSMRKMVEDILSLNHSRENLHFEALDLTALLDSCLSAYRIAASDKNLQISLSGPEELSVVTDEYLFTQILDNLISNAVRYTPAGEAVEIRLTPGSLSVENHGVTIPEELLPHIFDPFVSGSHENDSAGHGLGLYIAAWYAKQINVSLSVENRAHSVVSTIYITEKDS